MTTLREQIARDMLMVTQEGVNTEYAWGVQDAEVQLELLAQADAAIARLTAQESARVDPARIEEQRAQGWPDMHPEDYCHRCGNRNPSWFVSTREQWLAGTQAWAAETGREGICCPTCFEEIWEERHGKGWYLHARMAPPGDTAQEPTDAEVDAAALEEGTLTVLREGDLPLDQYDVVREHLKSTRETKPEAWDEGRDMARRILIAARNAGREQS